MNLSIQIYSSIQTLESKVAWLPKGSAQDQEFNQYLELSSQFLNFLLMRFTAFC